MPDLLALLALAAAVLVLAGLTEGFVTRAPLSFPMVFLGLGSCGATAGSLRGRQSRGILPRSRHEACQAPVEVKPIRLRQLRRAHR